ncbi:sugar phosphate isomerase/epimerase family protein [Effusibacillus consociatus]|uniref:Sugar phosphate isomerase/epimerase family protein n=1 Tax=Effusibacillus consociatus TaxID=1117041 RepID=A0ABV9Q476_9BACL
MKLGVFVARVFKDLPFEEMLDFVKSWGVEAVEFGTGNYPGDIFVKPAQLLADGGKQKGFLHAVESRGMFISAFSVHGNPLHPNRTIAREHHQTLIRTIDLAQQMGVPVVNCFSGNPGAPDSTLYPNFAYLYWPPEYPEILQWQWEQQVIPYWREVGRYAAQRGVNIGIEMHEGFTVHSPADVLRLREAVGEVIGAGFDASHLWTQGINPVEAVKILGFAGAIYHVSTKDMIFSEANMNLYGVLDPKPMDQPGFRSWYYRTIGYGHDLKTWADISSALRMVGYDYVLNIEQEDPLIDGLEGFTKAAGNLRGLIIRSPLAEK